MRFDHFELNRATAILLLFSCYALFVPGCATPSTSSPEAESAESVGAVEESAKTERRSFAALEGEAVIEGISYGPYRRGQRPGGEQPSDAEILEDLEILSRHWKMLRVYESRGPTERVLRLIREKKFPLIVVLGAWIGPEDEEANKAEVEAAIRLANEYPDIVAAVSVGNETQVFWSGHRYPREKLIAYLRRVRGAISQPITTADDYNFWNKPESHEVAREVDFILLHAYAMWNQKSLDEAVEWTASIVSQIRSMHPDMDVVFGETGWATEMNPEGDEGKYIKAEAGYDEQARFYREFTTWAEEARQPYFYFEAFDEPWKGSDDPREVEKHWGLYDVDRNPKPAIADEVQ